MSLYSAFLFFFELDLGAVLAILGFKELQAAKDSSTKANNSGLSRIFLFRAIVSNFMVLTADFITASDSFNLSRFCSIIFNTFAWPAYNSSKDLFGSFFWRRSNLLRIDLIFFSCAETSTMGLFVSSKSTLNTDKYFPCFPQE
mgnify:CR=1 FL=1